MTERMPAERLEEIDALQRHEKAWGTRFWERWKPIVKELIAEVRRCWQEVVDVESDLADATNAAGRDVHAVPAVHPAGLDSPAAHQWGSRSKDKHGGWRLIPSMRVQGPPPPPEERRRR